MPAIYLKNAIILILPRDKTYQKKILLKRD